jgi:serine/threonine protein kinase
MTAILGPPPECFLRKSPNSQEYWDQSGISFPDFAYVVIPGMFNTYAGQWKGQPSIPDISLEDLEDYLEGENKDLFLQFMRKILQWNPDDRQSASGLLSDPWLNSP